VKPVPHDLANQVAGCIELRGILAMHPHRSTATLNKHGGTLQKIRQRAFEAYSIERKERHA